MPYEEARQILKGDVQASHYQDSLETSKKFRKEYQQRKAVIKAEEMPWEDAPQGRLKHVLNENMDTMECALDIYQQFLPPGGASGKHRHMSEELFFVLEGKGYDLHWDPTFECDDQFSWDSVKEPKRFEWEEGDFVYIPPFAVHQHFNADDTKPARFISATNRIVKALGFDWVDQIEPAHDFKK